MDIKIRFLTFEEYGEYQEYIEGLAEQGLKESKVSRMGAVWVMKNIYNIDIEKVKLRPGTILAVLKKTMEETFKEEEIQEKN